MTNYMVDRLFSNEELENIKQLYEKSECKLAHQDYNLFAVEKRHVDSKNYTPEIEKINAYSGMKLLGHYFVKYVPESFTRLHVDNDKAVGKTIVTLIETNDLIGGETLMYDVYPSQPRPSTHYAKRKGDEVNYGKDIVPVIVPLVDGDSVIYDHKVKHGVCKVHQGYRIVLVSWYDINSTSG